MKLALFAAMATLVTAQTQVQQVEINAPYLETPDPVVTSMLDLARVTDRDVVYDLGCGDGRIVIAAARERGARGVGVDIAEPHIAEAREKARVSGVAGRTRFDVQDMFQADIRDATVVMLYLLPDLNLKLKPRLLGELKPGTRVVSHAFDMGDWKPDKTVATAEGSRLYLWTIPPR